MSKKTPKKLSDRINRLLARLFTNGSGDEADRLVLMSKDGRDLGGWCKGAVRDAIIDHMIDDEAIPQ